MSYRGPSVFYGLDVGSTTAKLVVIDSSSLEVLYEADTRTQGRPLEAVKGLLEAVPFDLFPEKGAHMAFTGTGGRLFSRVLGGTFVNEIIAHTEAATFYHPTVRTLLDMGGQDTKLVLISYDQNGRAQVEDFSLNTLCAAGTGSFLDQQAGRLGLSIEHFSQMALESKNPARVAGRCTVFAKSDMIHLQQAAIPDTDIIAGLCLALVRNLRATLARGKRIKPPMVFQGGVAANKGVRKALRQVFSLGKDQLVIPKHFRTMGAIGAVLHARKQEQLRPEFNGLEALIEYLKGRKYDVERLKPLSQRISQGSSNTKMKDGFSKVQCLGPVPILLGIDVGSVSTKMVVTDLKGKILAWHYGRTAGRPLSALKEGLSCLEKALSSVNSINVVAVGTTGSGRYLAGDFVGADAIVNEITAQAKAAMAIDPEVDTIFEIGGQDSKYIRIDGGIIKDFMMNRACAAGTGSFLEEQASRLGLELKDFGRIALSAEQPVKMGERCTVFMESDLVHYQQQGVETKDLVAGLCYAIVHNYLNKVVERRPIGRKIFYQGATALNPGIVAAFEAVLGKPVIVPMHCALTGAQGAALIAGERTRTRTSFRGFDISRVPYEIRTFECRACPNQCSISKVKVKDRPALFYGGRCERYEVRLRNLDSKGLPDLVGERQKLLFTYCYADIESAKETPRGPIGLPFTLVLQEWLPFFATFLKELGFGPVLSGPTGRALIQKGVEAMVTEPCFPVKVAHGHVLSLLEKGVKKIFFPAIVELPVPKGMRSGQVCPYVQSIPYTLPAAIKFHDYGAELLTFPMRMGRGKLMDRAIKKRLSRLLGVGRRAVDAAWDAAFRAQRAYQTELVQRGKEALSSLGPEDRAVVIIGRPYNALDPGANLGVHQKLRQLGVLAIPLDHLPLDDYIPRIPEGNSMYWRYGQRILAAGLMVSEDPRLKALYITNFGCGPDSFLLHYFKETMGERPFLELEIDEHSADAGALTRIEAFLDTAEGDYPQKRRGVNDVFKDRRHVGPTIHVPKVEERTLYIPPMSDHAYAMAAALRACGRSAQVLPPTDQESVALGLRFTSGKECYPAILTTGDMIKMTRMPGFSPERAAFFMPGGTGPCRFGQYQRLHRKILDQLGLSQVPLYNPNQDIGLYDEVERLGKDFSRLAWLGVVAIDLVDRLYRTIRPYVSHKEQVDQIYKESIDWICQELEAKRPLDPVLEKVRSKFDSLHTNQPDKRLIIGVVGEIYTRANPQANAALVRQLEEFGAEVWLPTVSEWILYTNFTAMRRARRERAWREYLKLFLKNQVQVWDVRRLEGAIGPLPGGREPLTKEILRWASPFVTDEFEGESILSVGKAVSFIKTGVAGLINVMPLTCMPGTIVNALLTRVREHLGSRPFLALACDGQKETGRTLRLEAFVHQARLYV